MLTIWKFPLAVTDIQRIEMPKHAKILTVQCQGELTCLWAMVAVDDDRLGTEMRVIEIQGTGEPMTEGERSYIGTFQFPPYVWHVFERL